MTPNAPTHPADSRVHDLSGQVTASLPDTLAELGARIEGHLDSLFPPSPTADGLRELIPSAASCDRLAPGQRQELEGRLHAALIDPVRYLIDAGGQRWRHGLMLLVVDVLGGDSEHFAPLAAAVEAIHTGSLVVDDVEDEADLRRGQPAAHHVFGIPLALNAATAAYFAFDTAIRATASHDAVLRTALYETYLTALKAAHAGQALDLQGHGSEMDRALSCGDAEALLSCVRLTHRLKSGAVVGASLRMAGQVTGAGEELCDALFAFGSAVGTAYQITDDVADLRGARRAGKATKRIGEDLRNGKVTMPLAHAVTLLPREEAARMWGRVREASVDDPAVEKMRARLEECGALDACMTEADGLLTLTWRQLAPLLPASSRAELVPAMAKHIVRGHRIA